MYLSSSFTVQWRPQRGSSPLLSPRFLQSWGRVKLSVAGHLCYLSFFPPLCVLCQPHLCVCLVCFGFLTQPGHWLCLVSGMCWCSQSCLCLRMWRLHNPSFTFLSSFSFFSTAHKWRPVSLPHWQWTALLWFFIITVMTIPVVYCEKTWRQKWELIQQIQQKKWRVSFVCLLAGVSVFWWETETGAGFEFDWKWTLVISLSDEFGKTILT